MIRLYDNAFSPFARKVRMALEHKGLAHEIVDGLVKSNRDVLARVNGRVEVPALEHDGVVVVGSSDIVAYLERIAPEPALHPKEPRAFAHARAWERCSDTVVDPIMVNLSYWTWAARPDARPEAWLDAARRDLGVVYDALERDLDGRDFIAGTLSVAELALFPHVVSARPLGLSYDAEKHPRVHAWMKRLRALPTFAADLERTKRFLETLPGATDLERGKIFWRGDRLEWVLARGFHPWLAREIAEDRVLWPGLGVPGRM